MIHVQQLRVLLNSETLQPTDTMVLDFQRALEHVTNNLDDLREKHLGTAVVKNFRAENGDLRDFRGHINQVSWSKSDACFLFHVVYDSDSDEEDMELWEVKQYETSE